MAIFGTKVKTVDSILAVFTQAVTDLQAVSVASRLGAEVLDKQVEALKGQAMASRDEAAKAEVVSGKLQALLAA